MTPQEFVNKLREEFDGSDGFVYRIYNDRDKSYTVEEFYKLPPETGPFAFSGVILVCRDGWGWGLTELGEVYGFPCPWNVPGPGEVIRYTLREEVELILRATKPGPEEEERISEDEAIEQILQLLEP